MNPEACWNSGMAATVRRARLSSRGAQTVVILSAAKDLLLVKSSTQMNADLRRFTQIKERQRSLKKRRFALGGIGVHLRSSAKICGLALDQYELDDSLITNKPSARPFRPPLHNANA